MDVSSLFLSNWGKWSCSLCIFSFSPHHPPAPLWIAVLGMQSNRKYMESASEIKTDLYLSSHSEIKFSPFYGRLIWVPVIWETKHFDKIFSLLMAMLKNNSFLSLNFKAQKIIDMVVSHKTVKEVWIKTWFDSDWEGINLLHCCSCCLIHWCC